MTAAANTQFTTPVRVSLPTFPTTTSVVVDASNYYMLFEFMCNSVHSNIRLHSKFPDIRVKFPFMFFSFRIFVLLSKLLEN